MKYCINCGAEIPDGAKFCMECGQKVTAKENVLSSDTEIKAAPSIAFDDVDDSFGYVEENLNQKEYEPAFSEDSEQSPVAPILKSEISDETKSMEKVDSVFENISTEKIEENFTEKDDDEEEDTEEEEMVNFEESNNIQNSEGSKLHVSKLSTYRGNTSTSDDNESSGQEQQPVYVTSPDNDPYWDDVLPEIENEIYQIPKDIILRGIGIIVGLFCIMAWLIYWLPQF